jgi:hypothetical protein
MPKDMTAFLVNGAQESPIHGRRPPDTRTFLILDSVNGSDVDWGHEVNNLADNNDTKNPGGRVTWDYGDISYPSPFSRAAVVSGMSFSVSGMGGKYDIEDRLSNWEWGADLGLRHREYRLTSEYISGQVQAKWPRLGTASSNPPQLAKDRYRTRGYNIQLEFPFPEFPLSDQTNLILRGESLTRWGPRVNFFGEADTDTRVKTRVNKFSGGFNSRMSPYFMVKAEYGLWAFDEGYPSIWQILWAGVLTF